MWIRGRRRRFSHREGRRNRLVDVLADCAEDFAGDSAVAGVGEGAHGVGEIGRDTARQRHLALRVNFVYIAHNDRIAAAASARTSAEPI